LPPRSIVWQIRIDATVDHGGCRYGALAFVALVLAEEAVLGEESLTDLLEVHRISEGGTRLMNGVGGQFGQLFTRKRVVANVQCRELI
jgi:hypothetical protein